MIFNSMNLQQKMLVYTGCAELRSPGELRAEIAGLRSLIKEAELLISKHEQALVIAYEEAAMAAVPHGNDKEDASDERENKGETGKQDSQDSQKDAEEASDCPPLVRKV